MSIVSSVLRTLFTGQVRISNDIGGCKCEEKREKSSQETLYKLIGCTFLDALQGRFVILQIGSGSNRAADCDATYLLGISKKNHAMTSATILETDCRGLTFYYRSILGREKSCCRRHIIWVDRHCIQCAINQTLEQNSF
jgi:hypothetical protein